MEYPEALTISGGQNSFDPLRHQLQEAQLPLDQDPRVQARCVYLWQEAMTLCLRHADLNSTVSWDDLSTIQTPVFWYAGEEGGQRTTAAKGQVFLKADFAVTPVDTELDPKPTPDNIDFDKTTVGVYYKTTESQTQYRCLMWVSNNEIWLDTDHGYRAGGHGDLNYFRMLVSNLRIAALPAEPAKRH